MIWGKINNLEENNWFGGEKMIWEKINDFGENKWFGGK